MRPERLVLDNFGPYSHEEIDFTAFSGQDLFLITGKTGSGKTTLFDALVYALYGEVPGERKPKQMMAAFAPDGPMKVHLTFSEKGTQYNISREIHRTKSGNWGGHQSLCYHDQNGVKQTLEKITPIKQFIQELLHLTAVQFTQIVLLPQGEFRRFLLASSDEKGQILQSLFQTEMYAQWSTAINDQYRQERLANQQLQEERERLFAGVPWPKEAPVTGEAEAHLEALVAADDKEVATLQQQYKQANAQATKLAEQLGQEQELARRFDRLAKLQQQVVADEAVQPVIQRWQKQLQVWEWLLSKQPAVTQLNTLITQEIDTGERVQRLTTEQAAIKRQMEETIAQAKKLTARQDEMTDRATRLAQLTPQLALYDQAAQADREWQAAKQVQVQAEKQLAEQETHLKQLTVTQQEIDNQLQSLGNPAARLATAERDYAEAQHLSNQVADARQQENDIAAMQRQIEQLTAQVSAQQAVDQAAQQAAKQAHDQLISNQIAALAQQLSPGAPCPVCGGTTHPHPATNAAPVVTQDEADQLQEQAQQAAQQLRGLQEQLAAQQQQVNEARAKVASRWTALQQAVGQQTPAAVVEKVKAKITATQAAKEQARRDQEKSQQLEQRQTALAEQVGMAQRAVDNQRQAVTDAHQRVSAAEVKATTTRQALPQQYPTKQDLQQFLAEEERAVQGYHQAVSDNQECQKTFAQHQAQVVADLQAAVREQHRLEQRRREQMEQLQREAAQVVPALSLAEVLALRVNASRVAQVKQRLAAALETHRATRAKLQELQEQLANQKQPDLVTTQRRFEDEQARAGQINRALNDAVFQVKRLKETLHQVKAIDKEMTAGAAHLGELEKLAQVMAGTSDNSRVSLEKYVQRHLFQTVLTNANQRLEVLSRGRYQLTLADAEGSYRKDSGLELNVYDDHLGRERSVRTLSGGESFITALALALGLGETVQEQSGGVTMETLFIDEGFGSLDQDALATAIATLRQVEGQHRMIGIISHVTELRATIPAQLRVVSQAGRSHVEVRQAL